VTRKTTSTRRIPSPLSAHFKKVTTQLQTFASSISLAQAPTQPRAGPLRCWWTRGDLKGPEFKPSVWVCIETAQAVTPAIGLTTDQLPPVSIDRDENRFQLPTADDIRYCNPWAGQQTRTCACKQLALESTFGCGSNAAATPAVRRSTIKCMDADGKSFLLAVEG